MQSFLLPSPKMPSPRIVEQKVNFKGLINSIQIGPEEFLLPLQEVIVNSIQSIKDEGNKGQIIIEIIRNQESILNFGTNGETYPCNPIIGFSIRDNGVGFTDERFEAYRTSYTDFGEKKYGCRGIGRYTTMACFGSMDIKSYFQENNNLKLRLLKFDNTHGLQKIESYSSEENPKSKYTEVKLNNYKQAFRKYIDKNEVTKKNIAEGIVQHCLLYLINEDAPTIFLKEENEPLEKAEILNDTFKSFIKIEKTDLEVQINGQDITFDLTYVRNYENVRSHAIHLCANERQVGQKITLNKYIPSFKELNDQEGRKYHLSVYVTGNFLDDKANPQRNKFSIPEKDDELTIFDDGISMEKLLTGLSELIRYNYSDNIEEAEKEKTKRIKEYILDEKSPKLRYRHLLNIENVFSEIPINVSDENLELKLHEISFKLEQKREKTFAKIFAKKKYDREEFGKMVQEALLEESSFSKDKLADLIVQRKSILKLLRKYLEWGVEKKYKLEEDLHNLIFTKGADSDDMPYEYHNLWIFDERLTFHTFTSSDKSFRSNRMIESDSLKKPDLLLYDVPYAYVDNPDKINSLVLFEFKRPGRDMWNETDNRLDKQLEKYFIELFKSKAKNSKGRYIRIKKETPKFGYIVCDLHNSLVEYNVNFNGFKITPQNTFYKINPELNLYFEVIDYSDLVNSAEKRHEVFFKALGINRD